jgi:integrase
MAGHRKLRKYRHISNRHPLLSTAVQPRILDRYWTLGGYGMARTIRDTSLETRTARGRLKARGKPYYRSLEPGLHLGYRKALSGAGKWIARHYIGDQAYELETIATADDYSDADGIAILNYHQAQAKARERMVARAHHAAGKHGPLTVRDAMEAYFEFLDAHRKTGAEARTRANAFILPHLGDIEVQTLTTAQVRKWHTDLAKTAARARTKPGSKQQYRQRDDSTDGIRRRRVTANNLLRILKTALNLAWREGRTPSDAAWRRVSPFKGVTVARARFLSIPECQRLINASSPDFRLLVQAALTTGARVSELAALRVADFNGDAGTVHIQTSKTGKARHIVLSDEGRALFESLTAGRPGHELMLRKANGQPWRASGQQDPMREACRIAKITPPISFHGLRHTWASQAVMAGMPLMVAARNLGHANTKMVEAHYGHLATDFITQTVRATAPKFGIKPSMVTPIR